MVHLHIRTIGIIYDTLLAPARRSTKKTKQKTMQKLSLRNWANIYRRGKKISDKDGFLQKDAVYLLSGMEVI